MNKTLQIYTDGSASYKVGDGGWAYLSLLPHRAVEVSQGEQPTTISRMELTAVIVALEDTPTLATRRVDVFSDSQYVVHCVNIWIPEWEANGWTNRFGEPVKNLDLIKRLWKAVAKHRSRGGVRLIWVRGHDGNRFNERVDVLAGDARKTQRKRKVTGLAYGQFRVRWTPKNHGKPVLLTFDKVTGAVDEVFPASARHLLGKKSSWINLRERCGKKKELLVVL